MKYGEKIIVDSIKENLEEISKKITNSLGFDVVFVAAPSNEVLKQAFKVCKRLGKIVMIASFPDEVHFDAGQLRIRERTLIGTSMYTSDDYSIAIKAWSNGSLDLKSLITQEIDFENSPEVIRKLANHELIDDIKTMISFD